MSLHRQVVVRGRQRGEWPEIVRQVGDGQLIDLLGFSQILEPVRRDCVASARPAGLGQKGGRHRRQEHLPPCPEAAMRAAMNIESPVVLSAQVSRSRVDPNPDCYSRSVGHGSSAIRFESEPRLSLRRGGEDEEERAAFGMHYATVFLADGCPDDLVVSSSRAG